MSTSDKSYGDMERVCAKMGLALVMLHHIERTFAQAILFGVREKDRKAGCTYQEALGLREKMTFGSMVAAMKEKWTLEEELEQFVDRFVEERNVFVHHLTTMDDHGISSSGVGSELEKRVDRFMGLCFEANQVFSAALDVSIDFFHEWIRKHENVDVSVEMSEHVRRRMTEFLRQVDPLSSKSKARE